MPDPSVGSDEKRIPPPNTGNSEASIISPPPITSPQPEMVVPAAAGGMAHFLVQMTAELRSHSPYPPARVLSEYQELEPSLVGRILAKIDDELQFQRSDQKKQAEHRRALESELQSASLADMTASRINERRRHDQTALVIGGILAVALILGLFARWEVMASFLGGCAALAGLTLALQGKPPPSQTPSQSNSPTPPVSTS